MNLFPYREKEQKKIFYNYWKCWCLSVFLALGLMSVLAVQIVLDNFENQKVLNQANQNLSFIKKSLDQDQKFLEQWRVKQAELNYLNNLEISNQNFLIFFENLPHYLPENITVNRLSLKENIFKLEGVIEPGQVMTEEDFKLLLKLNPLGVFQAGWSLETENNYFLMTSKESE